MEKTHDELIDKAFELRKKGNFEESLLAARTALSKEEDSADAWWLIALNNESLLTYDAALKAFEKSLELYEDNAYRWARYGLALKQAGKNKEAIHAFETALEADSYEENALKELANYYGWDIEFQNDDLAFEALKKLEEIKKLKTNLYINKLGGCYYSRKLYIDAIRCFKKIKFEDYGFYNLGLAYSANGQKLEALDTWFHGLSYYPEYESMVIEYDKEIKIHKENLSKIKLDKCEYIETEEFYEEYLNPFELLDICDEDIENSSENEQHEISVKTIQIKKKLLLQEIDLEDGKISWLGSKIIEKSRAITTIDLLNDEKNKKYQYLIYKNKFILNFLSKGDVSLFLMIPSDEIVNFWIEIQEGEFEKWFSTPFAKQYDRIFKKLILDNEIDLMQIMVSGRNWVSDENLENLFTNSYQEVNKRVEKLRELTKKSKIEKVSTKEVIELLYETELRELVQCLPIQFIDLQEEVVKLVRGIAIKEVNDYDDAESSKDLLNFVELFLIPKYSALKFEIKKDTEILEKIIKEEKEKEASISIGKSITTIKKEGIRLDSQFIPAEKIESLCWGSTVTRSQNQTTYIYRFEFNGGGQTIKVSFSGSEKNDFSNQISKKYVDAIFNFIFSNAVDFVKKQLENGKTLIIGNCKVSKSDLRFETKGWFGNKLHVVPWSKLKATLENGELVINSIDNYSDKISMAISSTPNAFILFTLINK